MTPIDAESAETPAVNAEEHDERGIDDLFTEVYTRLKAMASRRPKPGATLDTTSIVHELYLRMHRGDELRFASRAQFFAYAARAMRHLLANRARDRLRLRAGGGWAQVTLNAQDEKLAIESANEALSLEESLQTLERSHPRAAQVVELRYFSGLSVEAIGELLEIDRRTVHRDWCFARAFLNDRLG